jgi:hypothetical protein
MMYEMADYLVLASPSGRSQKAHIEDLDKLGWTLCGLQIFGATHRSGEDVCLRCTRAADRIDGMKHEN